MAEPVFEPQLIKLPVFGDKKIQPNVEFPTLNDLKNFPFQKRIKLEKITYQDSALHKIKLHFLQEIETPMLNCATPSGKPKSKLIDTTKTIRRICLRIRSTDNYIFGFKLLDERGAEIVNLFDSGAGYGEW